MEQWYLSETFTRGEIKFDNPDEPMATELRAKYMGVKVSQAKIENQDNKFKILIDDMLNKKTVWNMPEPRIIIEVTGGADLELSAGQDAYDILQRGIVLAAKQSDAWIVTGGTNSGVMSLIGNEVARSRRSDPDAEITCLGIATWGCVANINDLSNASNKPTINYKMEVKTEDVPKKAALNSGHNFFLLVDDGTTKKWGADVGFSTDLIVNLAKSATWKIPVVLVAIGGGPKTLTKIYLTCKSKNLVVILTGFGGATDIIADMLRDLKENPNLDNTKIEQIMKEWVEGHLFEDDSNNEEKVAYWKMTVAKQFDYCVNSGMITVEDSFVSQKRDTPELLSKRLLNFIFENPEIKNDLSFVPSMLHITRQWDRNESVKRILQRYKQSLKKLDKDTRFRLKSILIDALAAGQHEFVLMFDNFHFFRTSELLKPKNIPDIYRKLIFGTDGIRSKEIRLLQRFVKKDSQTDESKTMDTAGKCFARHIGCYLGNLFQECKCMFQENQNGRHIHETEYRDMLLLALAMNNDSLAIHLWRSGKDLIGTALAASILLRNLSESAKTELLPTVATSYQKRANEWQERAKAVLTKVDETQPDRVKQVLTRNLRTWQNRSVLDLAYFGQERSFAAHSVVISKMQNVWHGRIVSTMPSILIYCAALIPFLPVRWLRFLKYDNLNKKTVNSEDKRPINLIKKVRCAQCCESGCDGCGQATGDTKHIGVWEAQFDVYRSCMVRWFWHTLFKFTFLLLFTSFILTGTLDPKNVTMQEWIVLSCSACILLDIAHETLTEGAILAMGAKNGGWHMFWRTALHDRFNLFNWRKVDIISAYFPIAIFCCLCIAFILRFTVNETNFVYPRTFYVLACWIFWMRSMKTFHVSHSVGIYVVILSELIPTIVYFLFIYAALLITFAVPIYVLMAPTLDGRNGYNGDFNYFVELFSKVVYNRWWNLVQFDLDDSRKAVEGVCMNYTAFVESAWEEPPAISSLNPHYNSNGKCESEFNFIAVILYVVFIFTTNIAWMNVLIATLSKQVEDIMNEANELTAFNYMTTVRTYYHKTILPPPINVPVVIFRIMAMAYLKKPEKRQNDFIDQHTDGSQLSLDEIEREAADKVLSDEADEKKRQQALLNIEQLHIDSKRYIADELNELKKWFVQQQNTTKTKVAPALPQTSYEVIRDVEVGTI